MPFDQAASDEIMARIRASTKTKKPTTSSEQDQPKPPPIGALRHAIAFARHHFRVFPAQNIDNDGYCSCGATGCASGGKHPRYKGWQAEATTDEVVIHNWWQSTPQANIGIACGQGSDLTVLDVDGDEGRDTLRNLELEHGELPLTQMALTGSGGNHYLFKHVPGLKNEVKFAPGLDVRNDGGLIIGAGSRNANGNYAWEIGYSPRDTERAEMPGWLADLIRKAGAPSNGHKPAMDTEIVWEGIPEGKRDQEIWKYSCKMRSLGFPLSDALEAIRKVAARCKPVFEKDIAEEKVQRAYKNYQPNEDRTPEEPEDPFADALPIDAFKAYEIMRAEPREYSFGGLVKWGATAGITGLMASGKTTLMINVVEGWATGQSVIERACMQSRTLVVASPKEYDNWVETIGLWGLEDKVFIIESPKVHFGDPHKTALWFETMMERFSCRTFALDTLFDFYGTSPNYGGDINRTAMNEQAPLIMAVRARNYSGIVGAHMPKTEARAIDPRDPEEAMAGASGWWAQHRMRIALRRKANGVIAIISGKGGYGDTPILEEHLLKYDEATRRVTLGGLFSKHLGEAALPSVLETLRALGKWTALSKLMTEMARGEKWIRPGLKEGIKQGLIYCNGKSTRQRRWIAAGVQDDEDQESPEPKQSTLV